MTNLLIILASLAGAAMLGILATIALTPWMDRWGASDEELKAAFSGDELVPTPASFVNRAITIQASPEQIYPWLIQMGADKGGLYSYTFLEGLIGCPMENAEHIHPEWQDLKVGDLVRMCRKDPAPPPYIVAQLHPNRAMVLGHQENGNWVDLWQFVIVPQAGGATRLILRTRTMMTGGFWDLIHPGVFLMERGMLKGIKQRAEKLARI
jgi:hypothetical protein